MKFRVFAEVKNIRQFFNSFRAFFVNTEISEKRVGKSLTRFDTLMRVKEKCFFEEVDEQCRWLVFF